MFILCFFNHPNGDNFSYSTTGMILYKVTLHIQSATRSYSEGNWCKSCAIRGKKKVSTR